MAGGGGGGLAKHFYLVEHFYHELLARVIGQPHNYSILFDVSNNIYCICKLYCE